jgi:hypothetical protein
MSPLPRSDRIAEYGRKGAHLALRQVAQAPEQRRARRLTAQARETVPPPPAGATRVAVLTPRDWAAHVQWEGMIAQALRLRGADVRFITCGGGLEICDRANVWEAPPMPCSTCTRYVEGSIDAHGFERMALRAGWEDDDPGDWPEVDATSADDLAELKDLGLPLGRLVDIPSKWFLMGTQVADDPIGPITVRRFLRSARRVARGMEKTLDELRPDVVLLLNGLFFFEAICWELCRRRGIDVVTYERGLIKETLVFRRGAPACLLDMPEAWDRWKDEPLTPEEDTELDTYLKEREQGKRTIDQFWGNARFGAVDRSGTGRLVTLFTNLTWDSAVIGQELGFARIQDWVAAAIEAFANRPGDELVVRIHPAETKLPGKQSREPLREFIDDRFPTLPPNVRIVDPDDPTSSYPLMAASDVGLVFSSTTGLELAIRGKPVIVAGRTHYRDKGFTVDVSTPEEFHISLEKALADPAAVAPDTELARRYAYLFFFRAPIASPGVEEHVLGLARITVEDIADLAPGRNPAVDRICDGILGAGDFVPPLPAKRGDA